MPMPLCKTKHRCHRAQGFSLIEMIISLAMTALLLTATVVAIDASFTAYAVSAQQASTQASTRMVIHRLMTMVRTSTAHGPLLPDSTTAPPVTLAGDIISSHFLELVDDQNRLVRVEYTASSQSLAVTLSDLDGSNAQTFPMLTGVTQAQFSAKRRLNNNDVWVLERATVDLTVEPAADNTTSLEQSNTAVLPIRMIASTMPRKVAP